MHTSKSDSHAMLVKNVTIQIQEVKKCHNKKKKMMLLFTVSISGLAFNPSRHDMTSCARWECQSCWVGAHSVLLKLNTV